MLVCRKRTLEIFGFKLVIYYISHYPLDGDKTNVFRVIQMPIKFLLCLVEKSASFFKNFVSYVAKSGFNRTPIENITS